MENPENPYVSLTSEGINKMLREAIAPFAEDNRRLRLAFGYATAIASEALDKPSPDVAKELLGCASRAMQLLPENLPADLLITAGQQQWVHRRNLNQIEVGTGDRPATDGNQELIEYLDSVCTFLHEWFKKKYGEYFIDNHNGKPDLTDCVSVDPDNQVERLAWRIRDDIEWACHHNWSHLKIEESEKEWEGG